MGASGSWRSGSNLKSNNRLDQPLLEVTCVAKSRLREKELRRRRHRYWKRKKQRIKQAILEARLRKLEQRQQQQAAVASPPDLPTTSEPTEGSIGTGSSVGTESNVG